MSPFTSLKNHPFAVEAFFDSSLVLTYAVPKEQLESLLPPCLEIDSFKDQWGFVAVAIVKTKSLRPKGFPAVFGQNFVLTGYRIFVRYRNQQGKRLRGLYILKSETDSKQMAYLGNIFTHYNYTTSDIKIDRTVSLLTVSSRKSSLLIKAMQKESPSLPAYSPFSDWKEARRFAGPLPFTFTYNPKSQQVLIVEGVRDHWMPHPVEIVSENVGFIQQLGFADLRLANAFLLENIPYYWKKGKLETWKP